MEGEKREVLFKRLVEEVDRQINVVVSQFQNLTSDQLLKPGPNGGWSIAQNLKHLNLYFKYYNPTIKQALNNESEDFEAEIFRSSWLGAYFTKSMDYRRKGKIKAFKDYVPKNDLDAAKVVAEFIDYQEELLSLMRRAQRYNLSKIKIAISLTKLVKMRLGDVFQFVIMHNERHIVQAQSRIQ